MGCDYCGKPFDENGQWTGEQGQTICFACWEKECDNNWWYCVIAHSGETEP